MAADAITLFIGLVQSGEITLPSGYAPAAASADDRQVTLNDYDREVALDGDTTPAPTAVVAKEITIPAGGTETIDLTVAPVVGAVDVDGEPADNEDLTSKKLFAIVLETPSTNSGAITVAPGTNGYDLFGASGQMTIQKDAHVIHLVESETMDAVGASDKAIDFTGAQGDEIRVLLYFHD